MRTELPNESKAEYNTMRKACVNYVLRIEYIHVFSRIIACALGLNAPTKIIVQQGAESDSLISKRRMSRRGLFTVRTKLPNESKAEQFTMCKACVNYVLDFEEIHVYSRIIACVLGLNAPMQLSYMGLLSLNALISKRPISICL